VEESEGACLLNLSQNYWSSCSKISGRCDDGRRQHFMACSIEYRAAHYHQTRNGRRPFQITTATMRRPWFDHFIDCAILQRCVSWRLDEAGHVLCNILDLLFNKESYCGIAVREFRFILICMLSRNRMTINGVWIRNRI
jgi:hypothetical protein